MNAVQLAAPAPKFRAGDLVTIDDHDGIWELIGCGYQERNGWSYQARDTRYGRLTFQWEHRYTLAAVICG